MNINRTLRSIKDKYGAKVAREFALAIANVRSSVVLNQFIAAIEAGNIELAISVLDIDDAVFATVRSTISEAYSAGGSAVAASTSFTAPRVSGGSLRWDVSNPVAENYLRTMLSDEITKITTATREGVRVALANGYAQGQGPRQIALDIVGRVGANGVRSGGLVGLNAQQVQYVANMRSYLESGDYRAALRMGKRNRQFDRTLERLMRDGGSLSRDQIERMVTGYSNKLLKLRGDTIARLETASAVEQSNMDAFRMGMQKNNYPSEYVLKEWIHGGGGLKPREDHIAKDRTVVAGIDTPFVMGDGALLSRPHDPNAPAKHVINCTCTMQMRMDWAGLKRDGYV